METAKTLIRTVARAFYPTELIIILDALLLHQALRDDDLALLMGMKVKDLRRLCGQLREDGLLAVHARSELREGAQRPFLREYFWIDIHAAIDSIKWRVKSVSNEVERQSGQDVEEKKEHYCPRCKSEYTMMEILDTMDMATGEAFCKRCGGVLVTDHLAPGTTNRAGHERQSKLNEQFAGLERLLRTIDDTIVPANDFESALAAALPVIRDSSINPAARSTPTARPSYLPPATVSGVKMAPEKIEISLVGDADEASEADRAADEERKRKLAEQNALPSWHTLSTVTGEQTGLGMRQEAARREKEANGLGLGSAKTKAEEEEDKKAAGLVDDSRLNAYFAALKEEQQREAQKAAEEDEDDDDDDDEDDEDDDDDDDDDDFEDVLGQNSTETIKVASAAPSSRGSENGIGKLEDGRAGVGGLDGTDDEDASANSSVPTPKRVKFDAPGEMESSSGRPGASSAGVADGEDSEEDDDFEDAM